MGLESQEGIFPFFYRQLEEKIFSEEEYKSIRNHLEKATLYNSNKMRCFEFNKYISRCL